MKHLPLIAVTLAICSWTARAEATSSFRLVKLSRDGGDVVIKVAIHNDHGIGTPVEFYAHAQPARHINTKGVEHRPLVKEGLLIDTSKATAKDTTRDIRVPLADLAKQGITPGKEVFLAARWADGRNKNVGHQWGALDGLKLDLSTSKAVIPAKQNSRLGSWRRGFRPRARIRWNRPARPSPRPARFAR